MVLVDMTQPQQQQPSSLSAPPLQHQDSTYSRQTEESNYSGVPHDTNAPPIPAVPQGQTQYVQPGPSVLSNPDFLSRVEAVKADIRTLTTHVGQIASMHQNTLSSADTSGSTAALESMVTQTQVLNTSIKDQIKFLETDAARSRGNQVKDTQIKQLKTSFTKQLQEYRQEEANYERRYRDQIARQYRIVNPEASDSEVQEAVNADWGNEGVFQTAVSPLGVLLYHLKHTDFALTAQDKSLSDRQHRSRRRPGPPQRHPEDRAHDDRAAATHGGPCFDRGTAGGADSTNRAAHRERKARYRSRQCATRQGH